MVSPTCQIMRLLTEKTVKETVIPTWQLMRVLTVVQLINCFVLNSLKKV
jgi:hypothetical protein